MKDQDEEPRSGQIDRFPVSEGPNEPFIDFKEKGSSALALQSPRTIVTGSGSAWRLPSSMTVLGQMGAMSNASGAPNMYSATTHQNSLSHESAGTSETQFRNRCCQRPCAIKKAIHFQETEEFVICLIDSEHYPQTPVP